MPLEYSDNTEEKRILPPRVDFNQIAKNAIKNGIFASDEEAIQLNKNNPTLAQKFPTSILDVPYPNGPLLIEKGEEDVPEAVMTRFRKN